MAKGNVEYVATCPVCGGLAEVMNPVTQDFICTCCHRKWLNGKVVAEGVYKTHRPKAAEGSDVLADELEADE